MSKKQQSPAPERALSIELHLDKAGRFARAAFKSACERLVEGGWASSVSIKEVRKTKSLMVYFEAKDPEELWERAEPFLYGHKQFGAALREASIATRTGEQGWDDYALLASTHEEPDAPKRKGAWLH